MSSVELDAVRHEQAYHLRQLCGREELVQRVEERVRAAEHGAFMLFTGGPGAGKSALASEIARRHDAPLHLMRAHRSPARFLPSLVSQSLSRAGAEAPDESPPVDLDDHRNALVRALGALAAARGRAVVVIDGLDELDDPAALDALPRFAPPATLIVLTARPEAPLLRRLRLRLGALEEVALPPLSVREVGLVVERLAPSARVDASTVDRVASLTGGLPLLVRHAALELARAGGALDLPTLPRSLQALAAEVVGDLTRGAASLGAARARLVELLAIARAPLDARALASLCELAGEPIALAEVVEHLDVMSAALIEGPAGRFRLFHATVVDHVRGERMGPARVAEVEALFARLCEAEAGASDYALKHRARHWLGAGRAELARAVLADPESLARRISAGDVHEVIADLDALGAERAAELRRHAHFLARHPRAAAEVLGLGAPSRVRVLATERAAEVRDVEAFVLRGHEAEVLAVAAAPDGALVVSASADGTIGLWDPTTARRLSTVEVPGQRRALALALSHDGRRIVCGTDGAGALVLDRGGDPLARLGDGATMWSVACAPDGGRVFAGTRDGEVHAWGPRGEPLARWSVGGVVTSLALRPDGHMLAAGSSRGRVAVTSLEGAPLWSVEGLPDMPWSLAWLARSGELGVACGDGVLRVHDERGALARELEVADDRLYALAPTRGREGLVFAGRRGVVYLSTSEGLARPARAPTRGGWVNDLAISADGALAFAAHSDGSLRAVRLGSLEGLPAAEASAQVVATTPGGDLLAVGYHDGGVRLFAERRAPRRDRAVLAEVARTKPGGGHVTALGFSADGSALVVAGRDGGAALFRVSSLVGPRDKQRPFARLVGHEAAINAAVFAPSGGLVVTGSSDHTVRVWSVFGGRQVARAELDDSVASLGFAAGGEVVVARTRSGERRCLHLADASEAAPQDLAPGASAYELAVDLRWQESALRERASGAELASLPFVLERVVATPSGRCFAGLVDGEPCLVLVS